MATIAETPVHVLARKVWGAFAFTFVISRILVFLSMSGRMPDIHPQLGGTRLHHLNYGIFLLAGVGAALLFSRPTGRWLSATAILYGVALALTFDEFGMWLHLDTDYWQRGSFGSSGPTMCRTSTPRAVSASAMSWRWHREGTASAHRMAVGRASANSISRSSAARNAVVAMWSA